MSCTKIEQKTAREMNAPLECTNPAERDLENTSSLQKKYPLQKKGKIRRKTPRVQEQKKPKHKKKLQKMFGVCVAAPCFRDPAKLLERIWARDANGDTDRLQYTGGVSHEEPKGTMG